MKTEENTTIILADCKQDISGNWTFWRDKNYCLSLVYDYAIDQVFLITESMLSFEIDVDIKEGAKRLGCVTRLTNNEIYKGGLN